MPLKRTYILFFIILGSAVASVLVFSFVFRVIKHKNEHSSAIMESIDIKTNKKDSIILLRKTITDTQLQSQVLSSYIVRNNSVDTFIGWLENEGSTSHVPISVKSVELSKTNKNILTVVFTGQGDFSNIYQLISLLENAPYQLSIKRVFLNKTLTKEADNVKGSTPSSSRSAWDVEISFDVISTE